MRLTDQQIRDTVAHLTASEAARGINHSKAQLRGRAKLAELAIAGNPGARFVIHAHFNRMQTGRV